MSYDTCSVIFAAVVLQVLEANESLASSDQCVASFVPPASLLNSNIYKYMSERNAVLALREVKVSPPCCANG